MWTFFKYFEYALGAKYKGVYGFEGWLVLRVIRDFYFRMHSARIIYFIIFIVLVGQKYTAQNNYSLTTLHVFYYIG